MDEDRRLIRSALTLIVITLVALALGIYLMYRTALRGQEQALQGFVDQEATLVRSLASFGQADYNIDDDDIFHRIDSALADTTGLGRRGHFILATRDRMGIRVLYPADLNGGDIQSLLRRAFEGESGEISARGADGEPVMAAMHPMPQLDMALVAEKDLDDIREPFMEAAAVAGVFGVLLVGLGGFLFRRSTQPVMESLRRSRLRYDKLIETAGQGILLMDDQDRILLANLRAREVFGVDEKLQGRRLLEVLPKSMTDILRRKMDARHRGQAEAYEVCLDIKGKKRYLAITATPFMGLEGQYEGNLALISDVTDSRVTHEALERERKLLRSVLNTLPVGVWMVDDRGQLVLHNPAGDKLLGRSDYSGGRSVFIEFQGWNMDTGEPMQADDWGILRALDRGEHTIRQSVHVRALDNQERILLYSAVPLWDDDGKRVGAIAVAEDITEERRTRQLLTEVLDTLPLGVSVVDPDGRFVMQNPAGEAIWRQAHGEIDTALDPRYQGWWTETGEPLAMEEWPLFRALRDRQPSLSNLIDIQCFDGSRKTVINSAVPMLDDRGNIQGVIVFNEDITYRRAMEKTIQKNEQLLQRVLQKLPVGVAITDNSGCIILANESDASVWGFSRLGKSPETFPVQALEDESERPIEDGEWPISKALASGRSTRGEVLNVLGADGDRRFVSSSAAPVVGGDGQAWGAIEISEDITEARKAQQEMLRLSDSVRQSADAIFMVDTDGVIQSCNPAFAQITGYAKDEVTGQRLREFIDGGGDDHYMKFWQKVLRGEHVREVTFYRNRDGELRQWELRLNPVLDTNRRMVSVVAAATDLSKETEIRNELHRAMRFDALTGLSNRERLTDHVHQALAGTGYRPRVTGLVKLDIDRFASVNESLGYDVGNGLLKEVASRLLGVVRDGDLVARIGADSFAVLLNDMADEMDVPPVMQKLRDALNEPCEVDGIALRLTHCMGVALAPVDGNDAETLMRHADAALAEARRVGNGEVRFYASEVGDHVRHQLTLELALREALDKQQFHLHFQPQIDLATGRLRGLEALLRWEHPQLGNVSPAEFIPLAERAGLIVAISEWVLREALGQRAAWRRDGMDPGRMAVNLSAREFADQNLVQRVRRALEETGESPDGLELEITETVLMSNSGREMNNLRSLSEMGVLVSVDDFGTGYSSLAYLSVLPIHSLKIDRVFIGAVRNDDCSNAVIIRSVLSMARSLGVEVVAEGVETADQLDFLRRVGCDCAQGFLLARPAAVDDVPGLLRRTNWLADFGNLSQRSRANKG